MKQVYFDEFGNTGQDLLNSDDPVFALAACRFAPDQEQTLLNHFAGRQGPELKFSRLRKSDAGKRAVLAFFNAQEITPSSVSVYMVNKPFMVVSKYCDIVLEPSHRQAGVDFYERGLNIATANLLATVMPTFLNPVTWNSFLAAFVRMVRERSEGAFRDFVRLAELIRAHLEHVNADLSHYVSVSVLLDPAELLPMFSGDELDPLVPAYHLLANHWGKQLGEQFILVSDQSKVLAKERERLLALSSKTIRPFVAGYDRRTVDFPLKVSGITSVDSRLHRQVQFADIIAGAVGRAARSPERFQDGSFENQILKMCFDKGVIIGGLWPSKDVDPTALGTDETPTEKHVDLATYTKMIFQDDPSTKNPRGE